MQADEPLGTFLDYCTYGHMIDNVVLLVTGTLHERDVTVSTCIHACHGRGHCIVQCCPLLVNGSSHC
jgi:V-type H+-transporting ATPase subunit d